MTNCSICGGRYGIKYRQEDGTYQHEDCALNEVLVKAAEFKDGKLKTSEPFAVTVDTDRMVDGVVYNYDTIRVIKNGNRLSLLSLKGESC